MGKKTEVITEGKQGILMNPDLFLTNTGLQVFFCSFSATHEHF